MAKIFIDFETRSAHSLKKFGTANYAMHPTTQALCLAYSTPHGVRQWVHNELIDNPRIPSDLRQLLESGVEVHAFNALFEKYIWHYVMHLQHGWPDIPLEAWRDTMAVAAHANQPQGLDKLGKRMQLKQQKSDSGKRLIQLLSVPKRVKKKKGQPVPTEIEFYQWDENDPECAEFIEYNKQDVVVEAAADAVLPPMPPSEIRAWQLDRKINERGFYVDKQLCLGAKAVHEEAKRRANSAIHLLTNGAATAYTQVKRIKDWVNTQINFGSSLAEDKITQWLDANPHLTDLPPAKVLKLRLAMNSNAVAKFSTAFDRAGPDSRVRESLRYYRAATGRWGGSGFHPHTLNRDATDDEMLFQLIRRGDYDECEIVLGTNLEAEGTISTLKQCVRGIITAPEGKKLIASDFAGIEARVLHWLVGNEAKLAMFRESQDIYIAAACDIYGVEPGDIATWDGKKWKIKPDAKQKRQLGKVAELALGYGMGAEKFISTALKQEGIVVAPELAEATVSAWREVNEKVVRYWGAANRHAMHIITNKVTNGAPTVTKVGHLEFAYHPRGYLTIRLPSGRQLFYYRPCLKNVKGFKEIHYLDGSKESKEHKTINTYGGKIIENCVQAISRDLLVNSMHIIDKASVPIIFHVHDEVVCEVDDADVERATGIVQNAMQTVPQWCRGLPLAAETKVSQRYGK